MTADEATAEFTLARIRLTRLAPVEVFPDAGSTAPHAVAAVGHHYEVHLYGYESHVALNHSAATHYDPFAEWHTLRFDEPGHLVAAVEEAMDAWAAYELALSAGVDPP